ncbi:hypothetical protein [Haloarchaeobius sp. DFWS5]|uniref:hypothetical protein n=1 Tax=Haloarchaeobius sp. DFWS5 TaxID=3446114 RepID=UPI003EB8867B
MSEGDMGSIFSTERVAETHEYPESIFRTGDNRSMLVIDGDETTFELTDDE